MECPKCYLKYRIDTFKTPRILTNCGHSFCEQCLNIMHEKENFKITCPICNIDTKIDDVKNLIKNMALLESSLSKKLEIFSDIKRRENIEIDNTLQSSLPGSYINQLQKINNLGIKNTEAFDNFIYRSSTPNYSDVKAFSNSRKQKPKSISQCPNFSSIINSNNTNNNISGNSSNTNLCSVHSKPLEAFCDTDKSLLCVSCILDNKHKNHDLLAIGKAAQLQKDLFENNLIKILEKEKKIIEEIELIENHMKTSKYESDEKLKMIENFFKKIYLLLSFREEFLKTKISNQFDRETEKTLSYRSNLEEKLKLVEKIKVEKSNFSKLNDLEILTLTKERNKNLEDFMINFFLSSDYNLNINENGETVNVNSFNVICNGNNGNTNIAATHNLNFSPAKIEKVNFYDLFNNQEIEIHYLIKILKSLLKRDLFDHNFLENFEINKQKITTNCNEINLDTEKNQTKDFNVYIFSDDNLDKFANCLNENINNHKVSNGNLNNIKSKNAIYNESNSNNHCNNLNTINNYGNLKESKNNYYTQQNNQITNNNNSNNPNLLANSGKFISLANFGNNKLNDKLDTKSEISNSNKNNENNNNCNIYNNKVKNNNYIKNTINTVASSAAIEKKSSCFIKQEDIANFENQFNKKISENNTFNKQDKLKEKDSDKIKEKVMKKQPYSKKIYLISNIIKKPTKQTSLENKKQGEYNTINISNNPNNSFLNMNNLPNKIEKQITNNEILTDISPVHPHEHSAFKMYDDNITSFDSILDSSDNFQVHNQNTNLITNNKYYTSQAADLKPNNLKSYASKEKEKELFKQSQRNLNQKKETLNVHININSEEINSHNYNSSKNVLSNETNTHVNNLKGLVQLSEQEKGETKGYNKKSQSNTFQYMVNSNKKNKTNLNPYANLNNSSSVIEINYIQNQTDEEDVLYNKERKNNSNISTRNKENKKFKSNQNSLNSDLNKNTTTKLSSRLNIDLYKEMAKEKNQINRSPESKKSLVSIVQGNEKNDIHPTESSKNNGKKFHKIKTICPFVKNNINKDSSPGKKRLNNSQNDNINNNTNISNNININRNTINFTNLATINCLSNNHENFKVDLSLNTNSNKDDLNNLTLPNDVKHGSTFTIIDSNRTYAKISDETIAKEGKILINNCIKDSKGNENANSNKNVLIIRGFKSEQPNLANNNNINNLLNEKNQKMQNKKEELNSVIFDNIENTINSDKCINKYIDDQCELIIPKHKYNTSKDTEFLSLTATEEYLEIINSNSINTNKIKKNTQNSNPDINSNLINNKHNNSDIMPTALDGKEQTNIDKEFNKNSEISSNSINQSPLNNINDFTGKIFSADDNTSRSILRNDFASLYNPYNSFILCLGGKSDIISRKFSIENNAWTTIREMKVERSDFIALMYKEKRILIMGGKSLNYNGIESVSDTIDLLSTDDQSIVRLDFKLKIPRSNFGAVYYDLKLFVAGGYNGRDALNNFEYFDKRSKKWIDLPKLINKKKEFAMIMGADNKIYCLGGSDERELILKSFEYYDIKTNYWCKLEEMNQCRKGLSAVFMPDGIYAIGGYDGCQYLKSVEKYDFEIKRWKYIEDMNFPKCHFSCVNSSDFRYIYVLGGYDGKPMNIMERYDCLFSKWEVIEKLPTTKYRHQSVFLNE